MKERFLITILLMISIVLFCTSCTSLPRNPKDWQTVCIETWDYDSAEKLGGYIKIPPDWEVRTVTGVQSNKKNLHHLTTKA